MTSEITVTGGAYFAITPAAMMAGTALAVTFEAGPLRAWLKFDADVMIRWKPFYLTADASISIGVAYHVQLLGVDVTLSIEIGATFGLWGPELGFSAHVDWYVVSFTVSHGPDRGDGGMLDWTGFKGLLPSKTQTVAGHATTQAATVPLSDLTQTTPVFVHIDALAGLIRSAVVEGVAHWLVRPAQLVLAVHSAIPASDVELTGSGQVGSITKVGIRGLQTRGGEGVAPADYQSTQTITVLHLQSGGSAAVATNSATASPCTTQPGTAPVAKVAWSATPFMQQVPKAMWGDPIDAGSGPPVNEPGGQAVPAQVGATLAPLQPEPVNGTPEMAIATVFADRSIGDPMGMAIGPAVTATDRPPVQSDSFRDIAHVADRADARSALFAALQRLGVDASTDGQLSQMRADPGLDFADEPMEVAPV